MAAINDADGHVVGVTPDGRLLVSIDGSVAQADVGVKNTADARINPATEEKLEAVRALLDAEDFASQATLAALTAKDFSTQATLEALRLIQDQRMGKNALQYAQGKYRSVATKMTVPALGRSILQVLNPVGSTKSLTITEFTIGPTSDAEIEYWMNSTITAPTAVTPFIPNRFYATSPTTAIIQRGTAATGGAMFALSRSDSSDTPKPRAFTYTIPPGESVSVQAVGLASEYTVYVGATWIEEPI